MDPPKELRNLQVIIIGAGAAGIAAACKLQNQKVPYVVLQARNRVGGRLLTQKIDQTAIDLGGCWIHSYGSRNPLKKYVNKYKVCQAVLSKKKIGRVFYDGQDGLQFDDNTMQTAYYNYSFYCNLICKDAPKYEQDVSMYEVTKQFMYSKPNKFQPKEKRCLQLLINMKQHYNAASTAQQSALYYEYSTDDGGDFMPAEGYGSVLNKIYKEMNINVQFQKVVTTISYQPNKVVVQCSDGSVYQSKKVISSLPLGVLKRGTIKFTPQLPLQYRKSIQKLGMGVMNKIIVSFSQNFWGHMTWISIGFDQRGKFSHIYNLSQKDKHILCCFITDDFARKIQNLTDEQVLSQFIKTLQRIFKVKQPKVDDFKITRWGKEQFSMGSYTYFSVGSCPQDCINLRKPIDNTLWIVGEHCYPQHIGTAHGAFQTGQWAGEQVLRSLKWVNPIFKQPKHIKNIAVKNEAKNVVKNSKK